MRRVLKSGLYLVMACAVFVSMTFAQEPNPPHEYVGSKTCMPCHMSPAKGAQYKQWMGTKHAEAYKTLGTEESKKVAEEAGVEGDPQEASECLTCHVTGYEAADSLKIRKYDMTEGVGCETCHGPGGDYWTMVVMKKIDAGELEPEPYGLVTVPDAENCKQCHNEESPTFKGFDYDEMYPKIAHPNPQKEEKEE